VAQSEDLPFSGLRVLDLSQGIALPHCGMLLAQHGADVVKLEPPEGDWCRSIGQPRGEMSGHFVSFNLGKRSLALDLRSERGRPVGARLAESADVVLASLRPGVVEKLGLDYATVRTLRPEVIYVSLTGYGALGPYAGLPATDGVIQAFSGFMTLAAGPDGQPRKLSLVAIDVATGLYAYMAVTSALYARAIKGAPGRHIELSLLQCASAFQAAKIVDWHLAAGRPPRDLYVPVGTFRTKNGLINVTTMRESHFAVFCRAIERQELAEDARFRTNPDRLAHLDALTERIEAALAARTTQAWCRRFAEFGIMHAPVNDYAAFLAHPQVEAAGIVSWIDHAQTGPVPIARLPGRDPLRADEPLAKAPGIGEHSREILDELGLSGASIEGLIEAGVVRASGRQPAAGR
jgi:crotonobetainyl-CoA:carnitine CoA-transferase CaiB-like acyl-CoA transferase